MNLLETFNTLREEFSPRAIVSEFTEEDGVQVLVLSDLLDKPKLVISATADSFQAEKVGKKDLEPIFSSNEPIADYQPLMIAVAALCDQPNLFPCIRMVVETEKPLGFGGKEGTYLEMQDDGGLWQTHWIVLSKKESDAVAGKLDRRGFRKLFTKLIDQRWLGGKRFRDNEVVHWEKNEEVES